MNNNKFVSSVSTFIRKNFILIVLFALIVFFSVTTENFFSFSNAIAICRQVSILGMFATGLMFVMLNGYVDLSIGATASLASVWFALCASDAYWNMPLVVAFISTFVLCGLIGVFNGLLVTKTGMPALIATLAVSTSLTGVAYLLCNAKPITGIPESILFLGKGFVGPIPVPVIILAIILVIAGFVLNKTYFGRYIYATGSNSEAARLSGIRTDTVKILSYVTTAMMAAIAGIVLTCRLSSGQPSAGSSYQMNALIACAVGGISMRGGEGGIYNLLCGVFVLGVLSNGMVILGVNEYWQNVVQGLILVFAVAVDYLARKNKSAT